MVESVNMKNLTLRINAYKKKHEDSELTKADMKALFFDVDQLTKELYRMCEIINKRSILAKGLFNIAFDYQKPNQELTNETL